ncbi:MAG: NAD-dependent epimerase/dehydratase family protein [Gemmataceae bacterium]|nr:NAD-dependent epimerase/dehydratase family protein [Gemmataceae bacterium]
MNALVTGGGGFLGKAIVTRLRARGDSVASFARGDYPELRALGVNVIQGDLGDADAVKRAATGCDIVFHVAAKPGIWGPYEEYYRANVLGTENVVAACRACGISRLVYTSTPSVVFDGKDQEGIDESTPYPEHFHAAYPKTKAMAERFVLQANDSRLATVALRPHLIWGPGDNHLVPRILARARAGMLRRVGWRENRVDCVYIDNAADAHLLAADRLSPGSAVAGKAYFISQGDPWPLWDLVNAILKTADLPPVTRTVPASLAYAVGGMLEMTYRLMGWTSEPRMTRFLARELSTAHWFNITAARRDLGYTPTVSIEEGLQRLRESLRG